MSRAFFTKYGLALHLGVLAAFPCVLFPFLSAESLANTLLWFSLYALIWLACSPSIRAGEHLSSARARLFKEIVHDPFTYFLLVMLFLSFVASVNVGSEMKYDPELRSWVLGAPILSWMPSSSGKRGMLPFAETLALVIVLLGVRNALGLMARVCFGVVSTFIVGFGGLYLVLGVACGDAALVKAMSLTTVSAPFYGSMFGLWLVLAIAISSTSESFKWGYARLPFAVALTGCLSAMIFFAPVITVLPISAFAVLVAFFGFGSLARRRSMGMVLRNAVFFFFGCISTFFIVMLFMPQEVFAAKFAGLDLAVSFNEKYFALRDVLSRLSREIWLKNPWPGSGIDTFQQHIRFVADARDWAVLVTPPQCSLNGYWMLLAERGIVGCSVIVVGLSMLFVSWAVALVKAYKGIRNDDESDKFFFVCQPLVWVMPIAVIVFLFGVAYDSSLTNDANLFQLFVPLALAAASFPKKKVSR